MTAKISIQRALVFGTAVALIGCGGTGPVSTGTEAPNPAAAPQVDQPDRHVMAAPGEVNVESLIADLPQRLTEEEAKNLLVTIDSNKVEEVTTGTYSVLRRGGGGSRGSYGGHRGSGSWRGSGGSWRGGHRGGYGSYGGRWRGYGGYRYYGRGGYYFPYASYGGYYYPYFSTGYYPYLYGGYGGVYNPYLYYNPAFNYVNPYVTSTLWGAGYAWPGVGAMAARQAAGQAVGQAVGQQIGQQMTGQQMTGQPTQETTEATAPEGQ